MCMYQLLDPQRTMQRQGSRACEGRRGWTWCVRGEQRHVLAGSTGTLSPLREIFAEQDCDHGQDESPACFSTTLPPSPLPPGYCTIQSSPPFHQRLTEKLTLRPLT